MKKIAMVSVVSLVAFVLFLLIGCVGWKHTAKNVESDKIENGGGMNEVRWTWYA